MQLLLCQDGGRTLLEVLGHRLRVGDEQRLRVVEEAMHRLLCALRVAARVETDEAEAAAFSARSLHLGVGEPAKTREDDVSNDRKSLCLISCNVWGCGR